MTDHGTLLQLLGQWVTVTHPSDNGRVWHGQLSTLMDMPSLTLRMPEGGVEVLPQGSVSVGGQCIGEAAWVRAVAAYVFAALCLVALLREVGRCFPPGDYTDDVTDDDGGLVGESYDPKRPKVGRRRAARLARRELNNRPCGCDLWWTSAGQAHNTWCPMYERTGV